MSDFRWTQPNPDTFHFIAEGYQGGFARKNGRNVEMALQVTGTSTNLLAGFEGLGVALVPGEWESGIPKWKAMVEEAYHRHSGR